MKTLFLATSLTVALAACSDTSPPLTSATAAPKPAAEVKAVEAPKPDPDKRLAARVKKALEDQKPAILGAGIDVTAADGAITLWGTAASAEERARAGRVAVKVEGVKSLENKLEIVSGS